MDTIQMWNKTFTFLKRNSELLFWISALVLLFIAMPDSNHFTLCPLSNLGFEFCPGCGLGHSIHYAMWFDITKSFSSHPLGIVAIFILIHRIYQLLIKLFKTQQI